MNALAELLAFVTGAKRYRPEIKWSSMLWTHNIFRVYEMIFWRRVGIRCESAQWQNLDHSEHRIAYTFEARCKFLEADIRALFKRLASIRVYVLQPVATMGVFDPRLLPYAFAIAAQAYTKAATQTTTPHTASSVVVSGSNTLLVTSAWRPANATTPTSVVFNTSENATKAETDTSTPNSGGYYGSEIWYLFGATATTANNVLTFTGGGNSFQYLLQYTGVVNQNTSGTSSGGVAYSSLACFRSFTPSTANGWVLWFGAGDGSLATGVYNSTGAMRSTVPSSDWCAADSGATVAVSAVSYGYTNSSGTKGSLSILGFGNDGSGGGGAAAPVTTLPFLGA